MRTRRAIAALGFAVALSTVASSQAPPAPIVPRFAFDPNPIALAGPARPSRYVEASGLRAAFLGREDGSFEAWVYPLKVLHAFQLAFGTPAYAAERPGFGWFFGGDAFINSRAMTAYGDFQTVRRSLEFLRARQRA